MTVYRLPAYVFSQDQVQGVLAANSFLSLQNPAGSGRAIILGGVFISSVTDGAVSSLAPMRGWLATGISGGTLASVSSIGKLNSTFPDPVGQIRSGNPSATLGAAWFNSPTLQTTGAASAPFVHQIPSAIPGVNPLTLLPGEGTVLRTESGDINTFWNISIAWAEAD